MAKGKKTPADQAIRAGRGGIVPPVETRFQKGKSGNPFGRPKNFGLSMIEHMNDMAELSKSAVESIRDDESEAIVKRRAAERILDDKDAWNVVEHTHSRPKIVQETVTDVILRTPDDRATEATKASGRLGEILNPSKN